VPVLVPTDLFTLRELLWHLLLRALLICWAEEIWSLLMTGKGLQGHSHIRFYWTTQYNTHALVSMIKRCNRIWYSLGRSKCIHKFKFYSRWTGWLQTRYFLYIISIVNLTFSQGKSKNLLRRILAPSAGRAAPSNGQVCRETWRQGSKVLKDERKRYQSGTTYKTGALQYAKRSTIS